jgi:hypothetical protein
MNIFGRIGIIGESNCCSLGHHEATRVSYTFNVLRQEVSYPLQVGDELPPSKLSLQMAIALI